MSKLWIPIYIAGCWRQWWMRYSYRRRWRAWVCRQGCRQPFECLRWRSHTYVAVLWGILRRVESSSLLQVPATRSSPPTRLQPSVVLRVCSALFVLLRICYCIAIPLACCVTSLPVLFFFFWRDLLSWSSVPYCSGTIRLWFCQGTSF